ncbi:MAG: CotH kinase family protein [Clostridia bacterium]|nr:CotH kinase family protein [Clostridia bacterium]
MKKLIRWAVAVLLLCLLSCCTTALAGRADLTFSLKSGFYEYPMPLEITCDVKGAKIYYTTDGSIPDETDQLYEGVLTLLWTTDKADPLSQITGVTTSEDFIPMGDFPSAHVIRAVAVMPEGTRSEVVSGTFFIGYKRAELYGDLPVISLLMEPDHLFDKEVGIYVLGKTYEDWAAEQTEAYESWQAVGNYSNRGKEWERPVSVTYLPAEGDGFTQDMGVRIKGGASRGSGQKSLRLIARDDYGEKNIKFELYPDNIREYDGKILKKYKSVTLRNGGNDCDFGKIRDPYIQRLATGLRFETAANRPVIAFINGEFWGIYTLNEEYNDNYIENHYDINNDNVVTIKNNSVEDGEDEDSSLYWDMFNYITGNDMSDPTNYEKACEMLDMGSYADYLALMLYIYNEDGLFQSNNWQMWRVRQPGEDDSPYADGKWRMMVFDTDYSSGIYSDGKNFSTDNLTGTLFGEEVDDWHPARLVRSLLSSDAFRQELIVAMCDVRNQYFSNSRTTALLEEMTGWYLPYAPDTFRRFGPMWVAQWNPENHFRNQLKSIGTFFEGRYSRFQDIVRKVFQLSNPATVTIKCSDESKGSIYLNGRTLPITTTLRTKYFPEYPISVTAVPAEGAVFVGWEVSSRYGVIADPAALTTTVNFTRSFTLTAVFE